MPRNVSRGTLRALRRERRRYPTLAMLIARRRRENREKRALRERAEDLFRSFQADGATWAACVQAVRTGWVGPFIAKHEMQRRKRATPPGTKG